MWAAVMAGPLRRVTLWEQRSLAEALPTSIHLCFSRDFHKDRQRSSPHSQGMESGMRYPGEWVSYKLTSLELPSHGKTLRQVACLSLRPLARKAQPG